MSKWQDNIRYVTPYIPGEQPGGKVIKLNTNENPYPPAPKVLDVIRDFEENYNILRKYPEPNVSALRKALAKYHGLDESEVFVGVGSDDVLAMCFITFFNDKKPVLFADITYSFYDVWAELFGIDYSLIPLKEDFSIDAKDYMVPNGGIVIANPNAPTGLELSVDVLESIIKENPSSVVIIDEAYIDFGKESAIKLLDKYDNLVITRTFSKSRSLAGSRIGYALGNKEAIDYLLAVRNSFNSYTMDSITQAIGIASVEDDAYFRKTVDKVIATRERSKVALKELGFTFPDSSANFIFAKHEKVSAKEIFEKLRDKNIYARYFAKPRIDNYLRISIGTDYEMDALFDALREIL